MLPHGIASVPLDVLNAPGAAPSVHVVPSSGTATYTGADDAARVSATHAVHAATCAVPALGADAFVLARALHSGYELELRVIGYGDVPPRCFVFPAPVLSAAGVFQDAASGDVHVVAVTAAHCVYRIVVPLATLVRGAPLPLVWAHEHRIAALAESEVTSVHVVDIGIVLVACADGALVRVQQAHSGDEGFVGWYESAMRPSSFLSRFFARDAPRAATQTLALAAHVRGADAPLAFSVCRDRRLRVWNLLTDALVRTLELPAALGGEHDDEPFARGSVPQVQLFYPEDNAYALYVLVYVPAALPGGAFLAAYGVELEDSSSWSGGVGEMALTWARACDAAVQGADVELRDMVLAHERGAWRVWLLWHAGGAPLVQSTLVRSGEAGSTALMAAGEAEAPWTSAAPLAPHAPLHGPAFDAALAAAKSVDALPAFFAQRLLEPGRFSRETLAAVEAEVAPRTLVAAMACAPDAAHAGLALARRLEHCDRAARFPLCFARHAPLVIARQALGLVVPRAAPEWLGDVARRLANAAQHPERALSRAAGEAASTEYAAVVNLLARAPADDPAYAAVRVGGAPLFQLATHAAETLLALGPRGRVLLDRALRRPAPAAWRAVLAWLPRAAHERLRVYVADVGGDAVVAQAERLAALACARVPAAEAAAASTAARLDSRVELLAALAALLAALTAHSDVPALHSALDVALRAWQPAAALRTLTLVRVPDAPAAVHALHWLALRGEPAARELPAGSPTRHAPLGVLRMARALIDAALPAAVAPCLAPFEADAAAEYVLALAEAQTGRVDAALARVVRVGACVAHADARLCAVLPEVARAEVGATRVFVYYQSAAAYMDVRGAVRCYAACVAALDGGADVAEGDAREVWAHLFRGQLALGAYDDACATLMALPFDDLRDVCVSALVTRLCEAHAVGTLLRLDLLDLQPHVERQLSFQARNAAPLARPNYFGVLYAYHVARGDHTSAAASMYQHARRLRLAALAAAADTDLARTLAVQQAQSYLAAIHVLALLPPAHAWFAHALGEEPDALRGGSAAALPPPTLAIVRLADVRREYNELLARLELMRTYAELAHPAAPLHADDAVSLFLASDDFDAAFAAGHQLRVDLGAAFDALARKCVVLARVDAARRGALREAREAPGADDLDAREQLLLDDMEAADPEAAFLRHSPRAASWPGAAHVRAWRFLQLQLDLADAEAAARYRGVVAERLVALGAWDHAPDGLAAWFRAHAPDVLLRVWMRYGQLEHALAYGAAIARDAPATSVVPYTLLESLLAAGAASAHVDELRQALQQRAKTLAP